MTTALSKKSLLALEAVIDVALHARPDPVQAREITARLQVPQRYLEQVMQALVRAGILRGVRGPQGGYRLARERRRIKLNDIISVIDEPDNNAQAHSQAGKRVIAPLCARLNNALAQEIGDITLDDLCAPLLDEKLDKPTQDSDFTI